uniref:Uncharacterized protein n=1 Tax=Pipistrellus kuhlii TaxID=59472 RepID=A0A7J7VLV5_PIPKU|nr:hypothetical protein mPipKuh1_001898 [Pipistrellus kuhlii]
METGCWLLGGEFEDSVFEERRERRPGPPASYRAKLCEPRWFYGETESSDDVEALTVKKFRGDLAYRRQEYQKALQEYSSISDKLPPTNVAMKRDAQEGQARCLARLGRHAEALAIATNLEMKATNTDHLTTVLCLQLAICSSSQDAQRTAFCLQRLVCLHPFSPGDRAVTRACPHAGEDCGACLPETLPGSPAVPGETGGSGRKEEEALENRLDSLSLEARVKACASFVRTRLLLQLTQSQQTSFALERNLRTQQEVEDKVKGFGFREDTLQLITEVMGEDIVPEKIKDEVHSEVKCVGPAALAALVVASSEEFEDKWFRKIKDHFCSFESQFHTQMQISA